MLTFSKLAETAKFGQVLLHQLERFAGPEGERAVCTVKGKLGRLTEQDQPGWAMAVHNCRVAEEKLGALQVELALARTVVAVVVETCREFALAVAMVATLRWAVGSDLDFLLVIDFC